MNTQFETEIKKALNEAYCKAIDHAISTVENYFSQSPEMINVLNNIIEDLKKLK